MNASTLLPDVLLSLSLACAPMVHPHTAMRLVQVESAGNPYAIGINGPYRLSAQPQSQQQAITTAGMLMSAGLSIDMGLAMINSRNLPLLGLTVEGAFDACTNLAAMQSLLTQAYESAAKRLGPGQPALMEALSVYNTGNRTRGLGNGYVGSVYRAALPQLATNNLNGAPVAPSQATPLPNGRSQIAPLPAKPASNHFNNTTVGRSHGQP